MGDMSQTSGEQEPSFDAAIPPQKPTEVIFERLSVGGEKLGHEADLLARLVCNNGGAIKISQLVEMRFPDDQDGFIKLRNEIETINTARKIFDKQEVDDGMDLLIVASDDTVTAHKDQAVIVPFHVVRDIERNQVVIIDGRRVLAEFVDDKSDELYVEFVADTGRLEDTLIVCDPLINEANDDSNGNAA